MVCASAMLIVLMNIGKSGDTILICAGSIAFSLHGRPLSCLRQKAVPAWNSLFAALSALLHLAVLSPVRAERARKNPFCRRFFREEGLEWIMDDCSKAVNREA